MTLSPIALAATFTGIGVVIIGFIIGLVTLILRDRRRHKRMLADLEERGVVIAQSRQHGSRATVSKPRAVLRRNAMLPFNTKSGWGTLSSVETLNLTEPRSVPPHYAPPKPDGFVGKSKRLSWPFTARRASGKAIHMRKIRVPVLSTVIESPKPSPLVPVLGGPRTSGEASASPRRSLSRPSSDQSLLKRHPAFRNIDPTVAFGIPQEQVQKDPLRRNSVTKAAPKTETHVGSSPVEPVAEASTTTQPRVMSRLAQPRPHARSTSHSSGIAPNGELPPLPLEVARVKDRARKRNPLNGSPPRLSISSYESAGSSILVTQSSPVLRSPNTRVPKITKRHWRNSMVLGARPIRDTLTLHGKKQSSHESIKSSTAHYSMATSSAQGESKSSLLTNSSSLHSIGKVGTAESVTLSKVSSPPCSPLTGRSFATPKRRSGSHVTTYGSPEERRKHSSILQNTSGNLKRELSQASTEASSTRSSNGNPFQWDPSPMSVGKPSNLKGSPSARNKGHKRHNCVRISLTPTVHWPRSRSTSPVAMKGITEESPNKVGENKQNSSDCHSDKRSLPQPPSSSTFAPELKLPASPVRNTVTLPVSNYSHSPGESPAVTQDYYIPSGSPHHAQTRLSTGSIFSVPSFPSPCHDSPSGQILSSPPPTFPLSHPGKVNDEKYATSDAAAGASSPFEMLPDIYSSPLKPLFSDEYNPEKPYLVSQTPLMKNNIRNFSSPFSTIPEESSVQSKRTVTFGQLRSDDSPPCSPKTIPGAFPLTTSYIPIDQAANLEEHLDTIDPALLNRDAFHVLNTPFDNKTGSLMEAPNSTRSRIPIPTSPRSAHSVITPFPSSPPTAREFPLAESPRREQSLGHNVAEQSDQSSPYSLYSLPPPTSPSPIPPCSPRPKQAEFPPPPPPPVLKFTAMPTLIPVPRPHGPRASPPRQLRASIQRLRRMNSDAERGGREERRYLRLSRRDSIAVPGDESWLDELDVDEDVSAGAEEEDESTWDEEKGRKLIGDILNDWVEEDTAMLEEEEDATPGAQPSPIAPTPPPPRSSSFPLPTSPVENNLDLWIDAPKGLPMTSSPRASTPVGRRDRSSSIWEDGEKFWASTPPHPPTAAASPTRKPRQRPPPMSPPPRPVPTSMSAATATSKAVKKREFQVAKDRSSSQEDVSEINKEGVKNRESAASTRLRKRSALGVSTPNVQIYVHPPSSTGLGTPGSLYDAEGFLR